MLEWFLKTTGSTDKDVLSHLDKASLAFQRPAVLWVGLVLLVPIGVYVYFRQDRNLGSVPRALRGALSATRIIILAMLIGVLAGPYLKIDHKVDKKPIVALLFDHSQSMELPAGPFEVEAETLRMAQAAGYPTPEGRLDGEARKALNRIGRAKLAQTVVEASGAPILKTLAEKYDIRYYALSRELKPLTVDAKKLKIPEPASPGGDVTYLGDAVQQLVDEAAGRPIAGVLLFSDGQNTGGRPPSEAAHAAARAGASIYGVPVGSAVRVRDLAIVDVFTSGQVSVGDKAQVAVTLESEGFNGRPVKVELLDGEKLLDSKELVLRGVEQQQLELSFEATEPGARYLTVNVPVQPEEPEELRANNSDVVFLRVSKEKVKVLYVEGMPRWDFRFLKNAMRRDHGLGGRQKDDPDLLLDSELRRRPAGQPSAYPENLDQLAEYHTVILGDVPPDRLPAGFMDLLVKGVQDRGLGLIVAAGPQYMPHLYDTQLQDMLPVRLKKNKAGAVAAVYNPFHLELSPEGAIHEVLRLYDDTSRNQNVWSHMPPYFWCAAADRPASAATVLAYNPSEQGPYGKMPLIAYHYFGRGRVMFVGTDSTWLWRQNVGDRFFYKFWGQSVRFVSRRDESESTKTRIEVQPVRVQPGESAHIELMAFRAGGTPRKERKLSIQVQGNREKPRAVEVVADTHIKGRYTGKFTPKNSGNYRVSYDPGGNDDKVEAKIRVMPAADEFRHPNLNRATLEALSNTSGGRVVELTDLATIPEKLKGETQSSHLYREATIWDNWLTMAVLVFVYSLDVGLRRLAGLS